MVDLEGFSEQLISLQYPNRPLSMLLDRADWARSYCKLAGALESPRRGLFLLTPLGHQIVALPEADARKRLNELDRQVRAGRQKTRRAQTQAWVDPNDAEERLLDTEDATDWREQLLARLHGLSPTAFEEFCLYLLRLFGLELTRRGGSGDEGIDGLGTAPLSEVLSATVAVQVKRYDPSSTVGREVVALFQRDASAVGAERAILVTLGRFSAPARKAAASATPHVDLIDGERLCELMLAKEVGVSLMPVADVAWFDRFD
jgi:restriction system protein